MSEIKRHHTLKSETEWSQCCIVSEWFFCNFCWYQIVSSVERERIVFLTPSRTRDLIDPIRFGIVFGLEFFEPAILEGSEDFHRNDFFGFDEEIVAIRFARNSFCICSMNNSLISGETIISIATISCDSIYLEWGSQWLYDLDTISISYREIWSYFLQIFI